MIRLPNPASPANTEALPVRSPLTQLPNKLAHTLQTLKPRERLLIEYMTAGCNKPFIRFYMRSEERVVGGERQIVSRPLEQGEPLTWDEAAAVLKFSRRYVRQLALTPAWRDAMAKAVQACREAEHAASLRQLIATRDNPGDGLAADRKVQMQAAQIILGDSFLSWANKGGTTVNVAIQNVSPGYVIDLGRNTLPHNTHGLTLTQNRES